MTQDSFNLTGKNALVTGSTRGLGAAIAIVKLRDISGTGSQCPLVTPDRSTGLEGAGIADQDYRQLAAAGARRFDGFISPIGRIQTHQRRCRAGASHRHVGADQRPLPRHAGADHRSGVIRRADDDARRQCRRFQVGAVELRRQQRMIKDRFISLF